MKIWIVTIYEPLPYGHVNTKPQRCGMLADALIQRGHSVEIWTSAFDHIQHQHCFKNSYFKNVNEKISIQYLKGYGYPHDKSIKRFFHNRQTGVEFLRVAQKKEELPDIIFAPVPILELAESAVRFANKKKIPVIVDIRDLWPDVYLTMFPQKIHPIIKLLLFSEFRRAVNIFRKCSGITAVSKAYLDKGLKYAKRKKRREDHFFPLGSISAEQVLTKENTLKDVEALPTGLKNNDESFVVTYVGTFSKFCDIQNILDAAKLLLNKKNIKLVIVGSGDKSEEFQEQSSMLSNVIMTGWLDAKTVRSILNKSSIGLVAYSKGALMSLPNKPFEYMAAGLPILSSLPGELQQLILDYRIGRTYEAGNPISLANEIRWFYEHSEETNQMGNRSRKLFNEKFRSDLVYSKFSEHIEWMVANHDKEI